MKRLSLATPCLLLAYLIAGCAGSPPKGPVPNVVGAPAYKAGDRWTYQVVDGYLGEVVRSFTDVVASVDADTIRLDSGKDVAPTLLNANANPVQAVTPRSPVAITYQPYFPSYAFPLAPGKSWRQTYAYEDPATHRRITGKALVQVRNWERVKVPAGEFDALRITRQMYPQDEEWWRFSTYAFETEWYVPALKRFVRLEQNSEYYNKSVRRTSSLQRGDWSIVELTDRAVSD